MKCKKDLELIDCKGTGANICTFYFTDGNLYYGWTTTSDKAFDELKIGKSYSCSFNLISDSFPHKKYGKENEKDEYGKVYIIKNVRYK